MQMISKKYAVNLYFLKNFPKYLHIWDFFCTFVAEIRQQNGISLLPSTNADKSHQP